MQSRCSAWQTFLVGLRDRLPNPFLFLLVRPTQFVWLIKIPPLLGIDPKSTYVVPPLFGGSGCISLPCPSQMLWFSTS